MLLIMVISAEKGEWAHTPPWRGHSTKYKQVQEQRWEAIEHKCLKADNGVSCALDP